MEILLLSVKNDLWLQNIIQSGTTTVNYFKGGNPPASSRNIDEVHFVKDGRVVAVGRFREAYKAHIQEVYKNHGNIINGLNAADTYVDFVNLVGKTLPQDSILSNVIVEDFQYNLDGYKVSYNVPLNQTGVYVPSTNKILK